MNLLAPIPITDAMLTSSTVAEPAPGETAWVSGTYVVGDLRIRATTHRVYLCIQGHTGRTALPEVDLAFWSDVAPTLRWAAFDQAVSTATTGASPLTFKISAGFFDALSFYNLTGSEMTVTEKDAPAGAVVETRTVSLFEAALGLYEYLFAPARPKDRLVLTGWPLRPNAELTVTVTGPGTVGIGMCNVGYYRSLASSGGGTQYGASVEPISYSRIKTDDFGNVSIKRGNSATGMRAEVFLPIADANYALQQVQRLLDVPVSVVASALPNYAGLNVFGLLSASLSYESFSHAKLSITVKGMI
jgi:hypothetical protein